MRRFFNGIRGIATLCGFNEMPFAEMTFRRNAIAPTALGFIMLNLFTIKMDKKRRLG
jgi:hypothetical protein